MAITTIEELNSALNNPNEFKRLIKNNFELRETAKRFPGHAEIFTQPTVEQALKAMMLQSKAAQFYTAGAATGALASGTPPLPPEIGHHIGLFLDRKTGGRLAQTSKTAAETAEDMQNKNKSPRK